MLKFLMTATLSLEPSLVRVAQWDRQAYAIGNQSILQTETLALSEGKQPVEQGRLLLLSPFEKKHRRMTAALAEQRNQFIASIADDLLFIHAAASSQTEQFARSCLQRGKNTYTLNSPENNNLLNSGFQIISL